MAIHAAIGDDLRALSARVLESLPRTARSADDSWDERELSTSLQRLHASLTQQIAANEAELDHVNSTISALLQHAPTESTAFHQQIDAVVGHVGVLDQNANADDAHFDAVWHILAPAVETLQALDARAKYLATAVEIERRSQAAKASAVKATGAALEAFQAFSSFVQTVPPEYIALTREAVARVEDLSFGIKQYAVDKLQRALEEIEWPKPMDKQALTTEANKLRRVSQAFAYLVTLHVSRLSADAQQPSELWAIECLLEPIRLRFRYHFDRPESKTNRVTKPEWFLAHVLEQTRGHHAFLANVIAPELQKHSDTLDCVNAQILFLRGMILTAAKKLHKDIPAIEADAAVFCHVIDEVVLFEQAVDDEFGYASVATADPLQFPRVVDVLTADPRTLFAWTKIDVDYAKQTLHDEILSRADAWTVSPRSSSGTVPLAAQQFVALLDFMCRRFAHLSHEGHRYLYISEVHFVLLHDFHRECSKQIHHVTMGAIVDGFQSLLPVFSAISGAQYVVDVLRAWEGNPVFLELLRKVAESDKSRTQILKMHLVHSRTVLKNVAKAATESLMAREEAMAVRQAIAGPGAMIGPTAALSAAYSVGSKTVKSLFGRAEEKEMESPPAAAAGVVVAQPPAPSPSQPSQSQLMIEAEELLFSRTMFDKQVQEYRGLVASSLREIQDVLLVVVKKSLDAYRKSPHWTRSCPLVEVVLHDVSSELGGCIDLLQRCMHEARRCLDSDECFVSLWKPLAARIDVAVLATASCVIHQGARVGSSTGFSLSSAATAIGAVEPASPRSLRGSATSVRSWTPSARQQFIVDVNAMATVFQPVCTRNAKAYLRQAFDLCRLLEMSPTKLRDLREAIRQHGDEATGAMEQVTTILEACSITTLTPAQVQRFCDAQLGLC